MAAADFASFGDMKALAFLLFRRFRESRALSSLATVAAMLALPVMVPFAVASQFIYRRRMRADILASNCPACGAQLNPEAIARGEIRWREILQEILANHPSEVRLRIVRDVQAVCCACGAELTYREGSRDLGIRVR
jgi:hypothetical protein